MSYDLIPNIEQYQVGCITKKQEEFLANIKIQCFVGGCHKTKELFAVKGDVYLTIDQNPTPEQQGQNEQNKKRKKIKEKTTILCQEHLNNKYFYGHQLEIEFYKGLVPYPILIKAEPILKIQQIHEATNKLDKQSCCMSENIKFNNLKIIFRIYQLISNDDQCILSLLKDELIQKYFEILKLQEKIQNELSNEPDILQCIFLFSQQNQMQQKKISNNSLGDSGGILE